MPSLEEMRQDPAASAEGLNKAKSLSTTHLSELVRVQKMESEKATQRLRENQRSWWRLWQNDVDFPGKEDWQTKLWIPKPYSAVEQATALIERSLLESRESFGVEGFDARDQERAAKLWTPLLRLFLNNAGLPYKFSDGTKVGFITGVAGYWKLRPVSVSVPKLMSASLDPMTQRAQPQFQYGTRTFLGIDLVMPWNIYRDPDSRPRENFSGSYLYHCEWKDRSALQQMGQMGWDQQALSELLSAPDKGLGNMYATESQRHEYERKQYSFERHKFRKSYLIDEAWLDILDENGDVVFPNALLVHSNGKILYGPVDNPIWATDLSTGRRKWPFIAGSPVVHPSRFEGRGILEQDAPLSALFSNVFMLWADGLNWAVNPPTEIHQDALVDWEDLDHYPGKLWVKHTESPALIPANMGKMDTNEILAALNYIDANRQNVNFVTDFAVGLPGSRSDITKGEVQIKTSQSLAIFEAMGKNLEHAGRQLVELSYDMILQFFDAYSDPNIGRILGPEAQMVLAQMPIEERIEALQGNYDFVFTGVTQALQKSEELQKIIQFATLAASPGYQGYTNPSQVLKVISERMGVNERLDVFEEPMIPKSQVDQMINQIQMQLAAGPAAGAEAGSPAPEVPPGPTPPPGG